MDFSKTKGGGPGRGKKGRAGDVPDGAIDASPGNLPANTEQGSKRFEGGGAGRTGPKNIMETQAWKDGTGGARKLWGNYLSILSESFARMPRDAQEQLIVRLSQVLTIGSAILILSFFYAFIPVFIRVLALPAVVVGAWYAGTKVVAPIMVTRFDSYLNRDF